MPQCTLNRFDVPHAEGYSVPEIFIVPSGRYLYKYKDWYVDDINTKKPFIQNPHENYPVEKLTGEHLVCSANPILSDDGLWTAWLEKRLV